MKNKKLIIVLVIALIASVGAYFYFKKKVGADFKKPDPDTKPSPGAPPKPEVPAAQNNPLNANPLPAGVFPLKYGSRGKAVQMLQVIVGVTPDGTYGPATDLAVRTKLKVSGSGDGSISVQEFLTYVLGGSGVGKWPLVNGDKNNYVKALQIMFNLKIDGVFGKNTANACTKMFGHAYCNASDFQMLVQRTLNS